MNYSKFYTPPKIASLLVKVLDIPQPKRIIDICCGSCNLLNAAGTRWKKAKLVGVDIASQTSDNVCFKQMDGRKFAIQNSQLYPLILANPPFDYVETKREYPQLYRGVFETYHTSRLENEMLLANLLLLEENGTLLIIMPSSFVEAECNRSIRRIIGERFHVKNIIKLPEDTFGAAHINSYALEIRRSSGQHYSKFCTAIRNDKKHSLTSKITIPQKNIREGNWYTEIRYKSNVSWDIRRGNISSQAFSDSGIPVLHTAKRSSNWKPSIRYAKNTIDTSVYAEPGDIIVSRIGKSAGQWCRYSGERMPISDCLFRIKDPDGAIASALAGKEYNLLQKGVAARYITMDDFASWYNSIVMQKELIT